MQIPILNGSLLPHPLTTHRPRCPSTFKPLLEEVGLFRQQPRGHGDQGGGGRLSLFCGKEKKHYAEQKKK